VAPAELGYLAAAAFRLLQDRNDLFLAESSSLHVLAFPFTQQELI